MFVVPNFENINLEHIKFDEGKSHFLPFSVVYHILSVLEIWTFLRILCMNSIEMQYRDQLISERKNGIGCYHRPNTVIDNVYVRVLRVSTFATELDLTR